MLLENKNAIVYGAGGAIGGLHAAARDTTPEAIRAFFDARTSLGRQPTLTEVAETAAFLVSDRASALTGTIVNLSCGSIVD
jgi:enoyl-[acyl-carrier-protein] reductase (NADH)